MQQNGKIAAIGGVILVVVIPIIGFLMQAVGLGINIVQGWPTFFVKKTDRFSCELRPDTERGKDVWTVMYDDNKSKQPWLGMVIPMGRVWSPERRCQEIEKRLENFREDGLVSLGYRDDPNTPQQQVLCVKTKLSGDGCPLLMTLDVGTDGYQALRDTTKALRNGRSFYQLANSGSSEKSPVVYLETFLAEEDK
ncbi:MAG: hypothetical protein F6K54_04440 [Okeania sp. SIO3B5]|uniref:COP23 domain-containing protein n=1 Tax=Okeania sp. SIO3B5 TaxID=2607811 RepID=UPI0013FEF5EE|nr:COP23 domain-containing protein [Okeania sp. SIO3B5]NEO52391.1 hypothetical protein [Okeania sp. SIO3B5]